MKHSANISSDNIIEIHIVGKLDKKDINELSKDINKFTALIQAKGHKVKVLANYTHAGRHSLHHQDFLDNLFQTEKIHKFATYCLDRVTALIMTEMVKIKGFQNSVRLFRTRGEAEIWLSEP